MAKYQPMLCKTGKSMEVVNNQAHVSPYILEEKLDGIRCIAYCTSQTHTLINRSGIDVTTRFPEVVLPKQQVVLDGELCCYDDTCFTNFQAIQTRMHRKLDIAKAAELHPAEFVAFDCLQYLELPLLDKPYTARSGIVANIANDWSIKLPRRWPGTMLHKVWLDTLCGQGMEGVIAKLATSSYAPGIRSSHWLKFKGTREATYEVLGATYGTGKRSDRIGALLIGRTDDNHITQYMGKVGTGFTDQDLAYLEVLLANVKVPKLVLTQGALAASGVKYWTPKRTLFVKVKYQELTSYGIPRFPVFVEVRKDKGVLA